MPGFTRFHGRAPRCPGYDYRSAGWYFVTVVTLDRRWIFGSVTSGQMRLNVRGRLCAEEWRDAVGLRTYAVLGQFVVMPDHLHALVGFRGPGALSWEGRYPSSGLVRPPRSLGALIACFKASVTRRLNQLESRSGRRIWQRGFHDRIIRSDQDFAAADRYIRDNPTRLIEMSVRAHGRGR